ncbi:MAG: hypothetical protein H5T84_06130 [Thermoleophilia bacterium]|nr:hypothetical protein [Thermoleophilia bacterium]
MPGPNYEPAELHRLSQSYLVISSYLSEAAEKARSGNRQRAAEYIQTAVSLIRLNPIEIAEISREVPR